MILDLYSFLKNDRTRVQILVDKMNRRARELHAPREGSLVHMQPVKSHS